jgi:hypothetical protein
MSINTVSLINQSADEVLDFLAKQLSKDHKAATAVSNLVALKLKATNGKCTLKGFQTYLDGVFKFETKVSDFSEPEKPEPKKAPEEKPKPVTLSGAPDLKKSGIGTG